MPDTMTEAVYDFIRAYIAEHGFGPSQQEIADGCYMSRPNVIRYLDKLEAWGRISREPGKARSIRLDVELTER